MDPHIIVATDFSPRSDRALRRAIILAKQTEAALSLVHIVDNDQPQYLVDAQMAAARPLLEETARAIDQIDGISAQATLASGDVFSGILGAAEELGASLIVLGPHRRQLRDAFIGTTAERTIAHSRVPVLMAAGVPSGPHGRALVALDMDEASKAAGKLVRELAILQKVEILAMHAFDAPAQGMMKRALSEPEAVDHYVASEERRADQQLQDMLNDIGMHAARRVLQPISGKVAPTILATASRENAALVVVGTNQRTGLRRFLLGSVAEEVLADSEADVLVIPQG
ncbi:hypothetical protein ACFB49_31010 [Sphingomonas sp. DBB INV C78]